MIRLFRQRAADSLARCVACYSDAASPSTSRTEPDEIQVTRQRIKRWKSKSLALKKEERPAGRLDSRELQTVANQEEQFYAESAEEMMRILGEMTPVKSGEKILPVPKMTPEDIELKKKTGKVRFRRIIYDEGELDHSDLSKPPSPDNPHPYEPEKSAPPIYSRSIVPYVNTMPHLQTLVDLGVNLFEIDTNTNCGKFLLRLDQEKDIKPKLQWLISIGFEPEDIGDYITRNPFFLLQDLKDMQARVNYLEVHKFKPEQITKVVKEFRYWINTDVQTMDARLGWLQKQFQLKGNDVRYVITKEPRVIMFGLGPLKRIFDFLNKECQFTMYEIKRILLDDPRVFMMDPRYVQNNYMYASRVMQLPNAVISRTPFLLRCSISSLKNRHEFLRKLGRAHYEGQEHKVPPQDSDSNEPIEYVSMADLLHPKDAHFASKAAKSYLVVYDKFLRSH